MLWLWRRLAATAPIRPLAWDPPYATGAALEKAKKKREILIIKDKQGLYSESYKILLRKTKALYEWRAIYHVHKSEESL